MLTDYFIQQETFAKEDKSRKRPANQSGYRSSGRAGYPRSYDDNPRSAQRPHFDNEGSPCRYHAVLTLG